MHTVAHVAIAGVESIAWSVMLAHYQTNNRSLGYQAQVHQGVGQALEQR